MHSDFSGRAALVTASSSGLGKASAKALAERGADVVLNGRDESRLDEAVAEVRDSASGQVIGCPGDLTDEGDIEALVQTTVDEFGGLDHLVTNAGGPPSGPFEETSDDDWYQAFDLLVMSVVRLVREATPHLREGDGEGTIVNITSRSVKEVIPGLVLSNSVRMAVVGLEKTLSKELAPAIRVNAVLPGPHSTERMEYLMEQEIERGDVSNYEEAQKKRSSNVPLGRMGEPRELGEAVAYLSSEESSYINGAAILVDGGLSLATL